MTAEGGVVCERRKKEQNRAVQEIGCCLLDFILGCLQQKTRSVGDSFLPLGL